MIEIKPVMLELCFMALLIHYVACKRPPRPPAGKHSQPQQKEGHGLLCVYGRSCA